MMRSINMQKGLGVGGIIVILALVAAVGYIAFAPEPSAPEEVSLSGVENEAVEKEGEGEAATGAAGTGYAGAVLAGNTSLLLDFNTTDYQKALASDKLILLYFYASWCPICREEVSSALYPAFNDLSGDDVIGFRVNYNDSDTDADEKALAREFGVAYQHTKVFLKNGERILKSPESWNKSRYMTEISNALE